MCGIAGVFNSRGQLNPHDLKRMTDAIAHRGPDGEGHWMNAESTIGLGHRRLAIIDLSDAGSQPMTSLGGRYTIVFNGEIYNYVELKEELIKKGYSFHSHSDTEVLLNLFIEKGDRCLSYLDGMFAFAIWDNVEKKLFCARDRFGEKPFYYHFIPGKLFVFASEIKAIKAYGVPLSFHPHRIGWYLNDIYALSNPLKQEETFYRQVQKLEAGYSLTIDSELTLRKKKYWDIDINHIDLSISFNEAKEHFKHLFHQSVQLRLRSDVPIGTSLSGGLDSSSVVCVISEMLRSSGGTQKTFSARFKNYDKDEGKFIEEVIRGKQLQAFYTWPEADHLLNQFEQFMYHQEEPVGTANQFSQWEVMKLARQEQVTVLLDGQGADEIVTGYSHYFDTYFHELHTFYPDRFDKELHAYIENINPGYEFVLYKQKEAKTLSSRTKSLIYPLYKKIVKPVLPIKKNYSGLMDPDYGLEANRHGDYFYFDYTKGLNRGLYNDAKNGKLEDLLRYGDKNSMAHSREVRLPFLSHKLAEFVFSLPPWFKIHDGWSKYILRESMKELLPEKIAWRKDKIGYQTPQERWLIKDRIKERLQESVKVLEEAGILNKKRKEAELVNREWQILNIASHLKQFIK